jgi:hypothetical protein
MKGIPMRVILVAVAVVALSIIALVPSHAQSRAQYNRCAELAARQGLSTRSASGRRFINRCLQRAVDRAPRPSSNCPDDPRARSAYPAWMCP